MTRTLVLGGTFDPVHAGHINSACALIDLFSPCRMVLIPGRIPPHRGTPSASPEQRLKMLELATAEMPGLQCDPCELDREGPSYTFDTLRQYRDKLGRASLIFVMGSDAWVTLPAWHNWRQLCDLAHLVVMKRPGSDGLQVPEALGRWSEGKLTDSHERFADHPGGLVCHVTLPQYDVSATVVRRAILEGDSTETLLHPDVAGYIARHQLYLDNDNHGK